MRRPRPRLSAGEQCALLCSARGLFGSAPAWAAAVRDAPVLDVLTSVLRGLGQVCFVNNPITGFLVILALGLYMSARAALVILAASFAAAVVGWLGWASKAHLRAGLVVYNSVLCGAAVAVLLLASTDADADASTNADAATSTASNTTTDLPTLLPSRGTSLGAAAGLAAFLGVLSVAVWRGLGRWFAACPGRYGTPVLTLPFNLVAMLALAAVAVVQGPQAGVPSALRSPTSRATLPWFVPGPGAPSLGVFTPLIAGTDPAVVQVAAALGQSNETALARLGYDMDGPWAGVSTAGEFEFVLWGVLRGVAQVFFCDRWEAGVLLVVGFFIGSPIAASMALWGSFVGLCIGLLFGAPRTELAAGLWGYNSVLGAMALGGTFVRCRDARALGAATLAAALAALWFATLRLFFGTVGLPSLTMGFCLAALLVLWMQWPTRIPLAQVSRPEDHLPHDARARLACRWRSGPDCASRCLTGHHRKRGPQPVVHQTHRSRDPLRSTRKAHWGVCRCCPCGACGACGAVDVDAALSPAGLPWSTTPSTSTVNSAPSSSAAPRTSALRNRSTGPRGRNSATDATQGSATGSDGNTLGGSGLVAGGVGAVSAVSAVGAVGPVGRRNADSIRVQAVEEGDGSYLEGRLRSPQGSAVERTRGSGDQGARAAAQDDQDPGALPREHDVFLAPTESMPYGISLAASPNESPDVATATVSATAPVSSSAPVSATAPASPPITRRSVPVTVNVRPRAVEGAGEDHREPTSSSSASGSQRTHSSGPQIHSLDGTSPSRPDRPLRPTLVERAATATTTTTTTATATATVTVSASAISGRSNVDLTDQPGSSGARISSTSAFSPEAPVRGSSPFPSVFSPTLASPQATAFTTLTVPMECPGPNGTRDELANHGAFVVQTLSAATQSGGALLVVGQGASGTLTRADLSSPVATIGAAGGHETVGTLSANPTDAMAGVGIVLTTSGMTNTTVVGTGTTVGVGPQSTTGIPSEQPTPSGTAASAAGVAGSGGGQRGRDGTRVVIAPYASDTLTANGRGSSATATQPTRALAATVGAASGGFSAVASAIAPGSPASPDVLSSAAAAAMDEAALASLLPPDRPFSAEELYMASEDWRCGSGCPGRLCFRACHAGVVLCGSACVCVPRSVHEYHIDTRKSYAWRCGRRRRRRRRDTRGRHGRRGSGTTDDGASGSGSTPVSRARRTRRPSRGTEDSGTELATVFFVSDEEDPDSADLPARSPPSRAWRARGRGGRSGGSGHSSNNGSRAADEREDESEVDDEDDEDDEDEDWDSVTTSSSSSSGSDEADNGDDDDDDEEAGRRRRRAVRFDDSARFRDSFFDLSRHSRSSLFPLRSSNAQLDPAGSTAVARSPPGGRLAGVNGGTVGEAVGGGSALAGDGVRGSQPSDRRGSRTAPMAAVPVLIPESSASLRPPPVSPAGRVSEGIDRSRGVGARGNRVQVMSRLHMQAPGRAGEPDDDGPLSPVHAWQSRVDLAMPSHSSDHTDASSGQWQAPPPVSIYDSTHGSALFRAAAEADADAEAGPDSHRSTPSRSHDSPSAHSSASPSNTPTRVRAGAPRFWPANGGLVGATLPGVAELSDEASSPRLSSAQSLNVSERSRSDGVRGRSRHSPGATDADATSEQGSHASGTGVQWGSSFASGAGHREHASRGAGSDGSRPPSHLSIWANHATDSHALGSEPSAGASLAARGVVGEENGGGGSGLALSRVALLGSGSGSTRPTSEPPSSSFSSSQLTTQSTLNSTPHTRRGLDEQVERSSNVSSIQSGASHIPVGSSAGTTDTRLFTVASTEDPSTARPSPPVQPALHTGAHSFPHLSAESTNLHIDFALGMWGDSHRLVERPPLPTPTRPNHPGGVHVVRANGSPLGAGEHWMPTMDDRRPLGRADDRTEPLSADASAVASASHESSGAVGVGVVSASSGSAGRSSGDLIGSPLSAVSPRADATPLLNLPIAAPSSGISPRGASHPWDAHPLVVALAESAGAAPGAIAPTLGGAVSSAFPAPSSPRVPVIQSSPAEGGARRMGAPEGESSDNLFHLSSATFPALSGSLIAPLSSDGVGFRGAQRLPSAAHDGVVVSPGLPPRSIALPPVAEDAHRTEGTG